MTLATAEESTARGLPAALQQGAFVAWERAREDIFRSWSRETDPASLQPKVPAANRRAAEFLRRNPPPGMGDEAMRRLLDAIEAPGAIREQRALRDCLEQRDRSSAETARALAGLVKSLRLEPFEAPEPLPPIGLEEIHLIVWMAVSAGGARDGGSMQDA